VKGFEMEEKKVEEKSLDLETMSLVELKALAFDQMVLAQTAQNNFNMLQAAIAKRGK
jgi:hypothetical protein